MNDREEELRIQMVREALEVVVEPKVASQALLHALARSSVGELGREEDLLAFVGGPLRQALEQRINQALSDEAVDVVLRHLHATVPQLSAPQKSGFGGAGKVAAPDVTARVTVGQAPPRVLVISDEPRIGRGLRAAFAPERIAVATTSYTARLGQLLLGLRPTWVIAEVKSLPVEQGAAFAKSLADDAPGVWCILWGARGALGEISSELKECEVRCTPLDPDEGVDALVDLLRVHG